MNRSKDRLALARALGNALTPVVDLCLQVGLTSPEMETILRATFVRRARIKLPPARTSRKPASDVRVGLAAGLHRNEVRRIRTAKEELTLDKKRRRGRTERLIVGWSTDPRFANSGGHPRDLPLTTYDHGPSFQELSSQYLPGVSMGTAVRELRRQGMIQVLPDEVVRLHALTSRNTGPDPTNMANAAKQLQRVASTILYQSAGGDNIYREINNLKIAPKNLPLIRQLLERRTQVFLVGIERELRSLPKYKATPNSSEIGVSVVTWQQD